jgi:hypothetical protein
MNQAAAFETGHGNTGHGNEAIATVRLQAGDESSRPAIAMQRKPGDTGFHVVLLILCAGVLLASLLLQAGGATVVVPFINQPLPELCMLRRTTALTCPGCGLTRCFISLAHGDLAAAWAYNPAGIWFFSVVALQVPYRGYQLWRILQGQRELNLVGAGQVALAVFAVALVGQWLVRLIP